MSDDSLIARIAEEYTRELRTGNSTDIEEYARRHPEIAERIRELFPTLLLLEGLAGGGDRTQAEPAYSSAFVPGYSFGQYRIKREIGRGGMGIVYEAIHVLLEKRVALKVLRVDSLRGAGHFERFFREARTAASLHHTNIVPVFDVGQIAGMPYYAMQYVEGRGLDTILRIIQSPPADVAAEASAPDFQSETASGLQVPSGRNASTRGLENNPGYKFIDPDERVRAGLPARIEEYFRWVARIGIQAAEGLAHAHERKVIHRDIKPSNLLIDNQGVLWIADFGLARRIEDPSVTQSGTLIGTPRYMSPEQAEATRRPVDQRSDIYSLGATLYELLTFHPVFEGKTPHDVISQILAREPATPRRLNAEIPVDLSTIVMKAMAKRPEDRYQSASQLAEDLLRWLRMEPVWARPIGLIGRTVRWCRRNPRLALVATVSALMILALSGIYYASLLKENANTRLALQRETVARNQAEEARGIAGTEWKRAEVAREREEAARVIAENEKRRAESELNTAQTQKREADLQRAEALHQSYRSNLLAADLSFQEGEIAAAGERLDMCDPSLRGWEWRYLRRSIDMSLASQTLTGPDRHLSSFFGRTVLDVAFEGSGKTLFIRSLEELEAHTPPADSNPVELSVFRFLPGGSSSLTPAASGTRVVTISPDGAFALSTTWNLTDRNVFCVSDYGDASVPLACRPIGMPLPYSAKQDAGSIEKESWNSLIITDTTSGRILSSLHHPNLGVWTSPLNAETALGKREFSGWEFSQYIKSVLIQGGNFPNVVDGVFSQDRSLLATWSWDNVIHIWDLRRQSLITSLHGHKNFIVSACFSSDRTRIASSSMDGTVRLWSIYEGKEEETFYVLEAGALAYSPNERHIAVGTRSGHIHIFHARKEHAPIKLSGHSGFISSMVFSPDSLRLVTAGFEDQNIKIWDVVSGMLLITLVGHTEGVAGVAHSPDGSRIASGSKDGTVRIWSARNMLPELEVSGNPVIALGLTSGGAGALSISSDRTLRVWDTTQPKAVRTLEFNKEQRPVGAPILQVFPGFAAISQDKNQFASPRLIPRTAGTLPDYVPFVIDIRTGAPVFSGEIVDSGTMTQVGLTPDASRLAALSRSSQGGIIQLMDVPSGKLLETWTITDNMPKNGPIALSPDGNRVAVAVDAMTPSGPDHLNSKILVFKIGSPKALLAIDGPKDTAAGQPVFLPDGKRLAFIAGNNAHIWNLHTHRGSAILKGHHNSIGAIVSSPDGSRIVTGGSDGTVRIWDGNRYEHMFTLRTSRDEGIQSLAVSSDGMCIAAGTTSGRIYLWNASQPGEL